MADGAYVTPRGFNGFAEFEDTYGCTVRVQQSSSAERDCVWVYTSGGHAGDNDGHAHLNARQARILRDALNEFLDYAEEDELE